MNKEQILKINASRKRQRIIGGYIEKIIVIFCLGWIGIGVTAFFARLFFVMLTGFSFYD